MSDLNWYKASDCESSGCVEVAYDESGVWLRDSKMENSPLVHFNYEQWAGFVSNLPAQAATRT